MLMTSSLETLQCVFCISYLVQFQGGQIGEVKALINSGSKVNAINSAFTANLGLSSQPTGIGAQKIDNSGLKTYDMVIVGFSIQDMSDKIRFLEETFLLADNSMEVVLEMPFLAFSNIGI